MKILFIGGTGNISLSTSKHLIALGHELWLVNRTGRHDELSSAQFITGDIDASAVHQALAGHSWDAVVDWIGFTVKDVQRDFRLFAGKTAQYVFISSASCYKNPGPSQYITELTPLENPFWQYSRDKIACERFLHNTYVDAGFPVTIVRPSHTYARVIPLTIGGWNEYTTVARMKMGKPIVVQGDGTSLWTITHADDFALGFVGLLGNPQALGESVHITSDEAISWNEIYQLTASALGVKADIVHVTSDLICKLDESYRGTLLGDKALSTLFDNSKIKHLVPEFNANIGFAEGIQKTLSWFEADPQRQYIATKTDAFIDELIRRSGMRLTH